MHLLAEDISIHVFDPDDGSASGAIKVMHRASNNQAVNDDTPSQAENLRRALSKLVESMNPNPEHIPAPKLLPFDLVRVKLPESIHEGKIMRLSWDFPRSEWKYFVECPKQVVSAWYVDADLELHQED